MFKKNKSVRTLDPMVVDIVGQTTFLILQTNTLGIVRINLVKITVKHLQPNIMDRIT